MQTQNINELDTVDGKDRTVQMELPLEDPKTLSNELKSKSEGEVARETEIAQIKDLEDLLQVGRMNPYGTNDKRIFEKRVKGMDLDAMRHLAIQVGVQPISNSTKMKLRLLENFSSFVRNTRSVIGQSNPSIDPTSEEYKSIKQFVGFKSST